MSDQMSAQLSDQISDQVSDEPFDLHAGDDLDLVVETARKWATTELAPRLRESEKARGLTPELSQAWQELGLTHLEVPESLDGAGLGCLARVLLNEELAAGDVGAALALDPFGAALSAALEVGGEPAVDALLEATGQGRTRALLIVDDDATYELSDASVRFDVPWVPAEAAGLVALLTRNELVFLTSGFEFSPVRGAGLRAAGGAALHAASAPIAHRWSSTEGATRARARTRLYYASLLLGVLRATCDFSADYSQQRQAFGKPIGHHQALAFLMIDMRMALDAARLVVHEAAWRVDHALPCAIEAASAWAECIEASRTIGPNGVQILGGHGFMADYPVEKHMRESRALGLLCGGFDAAIEEAGRGLIESATPLALGVKGAL
jgi:alkylation response protein AidB-like acyl-CoA dehydrogenase